MKRIISALALVGVTALGIAGCGGDDDDDTTNGAAGKGGTSGTGGEATRDTGGEPARTTGGAPSENVACDPDEEGVCQNAVDCPYVVDGTARITAGECGKDCLMSGGDEDCSRDCILEALAMSSECATCYADTVACTIGKCLAQCFAEPEADVCKQCQVAQGCRAAFDDCSGLPG